MTNSKECLQLLLSHEAEVNVTDNVSYNNYDGNYHYHKNNSNNIGYYLKDGWTPLQWAAQENNKECLELLLSHGAKVNVKENVSE